MAKTVNLDAMVKRADFGVDNTNSQQNTYETIKDIAIRDFLPGSLTTPILRKPDFQRETSHWSPEQVLSLLECFITGELIPSVILWRSPKFLFVIDGCHRLSVIKAWILDDYGDGVLSKELFGDDLPIEQIKAADKTRKLINNKIKPWSYYNNIISNSLPISEEDSYIINTISTRGFNVQWVQGNVEKAETSFFNINMKGTPLDDIEELLLKNRKKPIPIASRAIIRAGKGHKYWSYFDEETSIKIEKYASELHKTLFDPEIKRPLKTLDLPLGGSKGVRTALQVLIEFIRLSSREQQKKELLDISKTGDDNDGKGTIKTLIKAIKLAKKITGNSDGSLGLHPAIYYYGPTGRHSSPMFLGTVSVISEKLANNDKSFFTKFSKNRETIESILINNKELLATVLQKLTSKQRIPRYHILLNKLFNHVFQGNTVDEELIISFAELGGKILTGSFKKRNQEISDDAKSKAFIDVALKNSIKCPLCNGYIDTEKSVSYDHIIRKRDGGSGDPENVQLTHPFCNQSLKQ